MIIQIPFDGLYESKYSAILDSQEEQFSEYYAEENDVPQDKVRDWLYRSCSYQIGYEHIAEKYAECFADYLSEELGFPCGLEYSDMSSPKEYNFETDRIFCRIPDDTVTRLFAMVDKDHLRKVMRERHTSYDGFYSHYSNDLESWGLDPLGWDHNQLMTLLIACIPDFDYWDIYYSVDENSYQAFDLCLNMETLDAHLQEYRDEIEANDKRVKPIPRCTQTLEMEF
jgi:hypothetical protein